MTSFKIDIEYDDAEVQAAFDRLIERSQRLRPVLVAFGEYLIGSHHRRWSAGVAPDGSAWAPLKPATWAQKRGTKPLYEEGDLLRGGIYQASESDLLFGLSDWKAPIHHFGARTGPHTITPRGKKALAWPGAAHPVKSVNHPGSTIPARPLIGISEDDKRELLLTAGQALREGWGR